MSHADELKVFHLTHSLIRADLGRLEDELHIDLGFAAAEKERDVSASSDYLPQVAASIRVEAADMARHYEIFYCLENFIRDLVGDALLASHGHEWWDKAVPEIVKVNVQKNMNREREAGMTQRSTDLIDYTTFGELGEIINANWSVFSDTFNNQRAVSKIINGLNLLRAPIAHCSPLAPDEVVRLQLALKDWFRLMS